MISPIRRGAAAALCMTVLLTGAGCRREEDSSSSSMPDSSGPMAGDQLLEKNSGDKSLSSIIESIRDEFSTGGVYEPAEVDDTVLRERYGLSDEEVADYYGYYSSVDGYADTLLAVRARPGMVDQVAETLTEYRDKLAASLEQSGAAHAYERAKNALVLTRGDYAFLVAVNSLDPDSTEVPLFDSENKLVTEIINKSFA